MKKNIALLLIGILLMGTVFGQSAKNDPVFGKWPKGSSPEEIGKRVADHFVVTPHQNHNGNPKPPKSITYQEVCTWYGALTFAKVSNNNDLSSGLVKRFEPLFGIEDSLVPKAVHVDATVFGSVPLEIYMQNKEKKYLDLGLPFAEKQWGQPISKHVLPYVDRLMANGYSWQTRLWIDDMYMITAIQSQAYRATGDRKYIDRAAKEMVLYLDSLQRPNGLFYHSPEVPFFWGRGNGWMAAGMSELLTSLPKDSPYRDRIMQGYKSMMATLLKYQSDSGMWRQLIDDPESWYETSGTGMFTFAFITGVKNGWLDKKVYGPAARKGWLALITYIDENNNVREVCEGTNKKNDRDHYMKRKRITGDMHGQAPVLWCATAWLR